MVIGTFAILHYSLSSWTIYFYIRCFRDSFMVKRDNFFLVEDRSYYGIIILLIIIIMPMMSIIPRTASSQGESAFFNNFGVTFEFPLTWGLEQRIVNSNLDAIHLYPPGFLGKYPTDPDIMITIEGTDHTSLEEDIETQDWIIGSSYSDYKITDSRTTAVANIPGIERTFTYVSPTSDYILEGKEYFFKRGDNLYTIRYIAGLSWFNAELPVLQNLVSSFRLTH
jgi:hypothetical protein